MESSQPGQSPFLAGSTPGPGAPDLQPPEAPRLGISHLLVLTACVAVCLGLYRVMMLAIPEHLVEGPAALMGTAGALYGIAGGGALAGLLLWVARRIRGRPFPTHPGEYLLVMRALWSMLDLAFSVAVIWALASDRIEDLVRLRGWDGRLGSLFVKAVILVWALVRVKSARWRVFLLSVPAAGLGGMIASFLLSRAMPPRIALPVSQAFPLLASLVLLVVVLMDLRGARPYPWTHWFGVVLWFCFDAFRVSSVVLMATSLP